MRVLCSLGLAVSLTAACSRKAADTTDSVRVARDTTGVVRVDSARDTAVSGSAELPKGGRPIVDPATGAAGDTVRGIVRRVGAEPLSRLALAASGDAGGALLALSGPQLPELAAAEGLEIMVSGVRTKERAFEVSPTGAVVFRVNQYFVRAVDGVEARDGVLVEMNGHPFLETAPGVREPIVGLPTALKGEIGARIFLVGPRGSTPQAFGVLRKP